MRVLDNRQELEWMLKGLGVLGTGGGGDPWAWGLSVIEADLDKGRSYQIVSPDEVEDDALIVSGGYLGSVAEDRSLNRVIDEWEESFELKRALEELELMLGEKISYIVPFEMGGGNTPVILSAGARLGIPVVDGDAVGRAAPETHMTSFIGHGVSLTPMPLVNAKGAVVIVKSSDSLTLPDDVGRFLVSTHPGFMANAHYPMNGVDLKRTVIPHTISESIEWGHFLASLEGSAEAKLSAICERFSAMPLIYGRVESMTGENRGGFYHARTQIGGLGAFEGHAVEIRIKNEFMLARRDGQVVTVFPDLIMMLDPKTNEGVLTPDIDEGREVIAFVRPCHDRLRAAMRSDIGAAAFSSKRYDEDVPYTPVEQLLGGRG